MTGPTDGPLAAPPTDPLAVPPTERPHPVPPMMYPVTRNCPPGAGEGSGRLLSVTPLLTKRRTVDLCRVGSSLCQVR